ncbi:MAG: NlpC/P60 family protein [Pikeienuella sp.]
MTADRFSEADATTRAEIVAAALAWTGTPYCHQASVAGAGTDCLGLLRGVWRTVYGSEPETPPPYTPDWAETGGAEDLLAAARRHMVEIPRARVGAGDVLVFRMRARGPAKHVAILISDALAPGRILHAYSGLAVAQTHLTPAYLRRIAGVFRFPSKRGR